MCTVAPAMIPQLRDKATLPLILLAVISVLSFGARAALIGEPCQSPCTKAGQHTLIFDEAYYVNAARVIAGIRPPSGSHYANAPLGTDPNAEHPQLVKLVMAGAIELLGDGPLAWRIGSLFMGSIAILGMFALVRAARGGRWTALGASTLMACDNLLLVHGRIGTLDIYAVAAMIWCVALYLRGRPLAAGLVLAVGSACKLVAPYVLAVLVFLELARLVLAARDPTVERDWRPGPALRRLVICGFSAAGVFMAILAVMDQIATPYNDAAAQLITGGAFDHFAHMVSYASTLISPHGPQGIASYPWDWLVDLKPTPTCGSIHLCPGTACSPSTRCRSSWASSARLSWPSASSPSRSRSCGWSAGPGPASGRPVPGPAARRLWPETRSSQSSACAGFSAPGARLQYSACSTNAPATSTTWSWSCPGCTSPGPGWPQPSGACGDAGPPDWWRSGR